MRKLIPLSDRFWAKVGVGSPGECWEWQAFCLPNGYGTIGVGSEINGTNRKAYAHRVSWELAHGPIPAGMDVCHTCDNPPCVNSAHLFLGTKSDNMRDASAKGRIRNQYDGVVITHCPQGHLYDDANTTTTRKGSRMCRRCGRERQAAIRARADKPRGSPQECSECGAGPLNGEKGLNIHTAQMH